jgi:hypothetical protein
LRDSLNAGAFSHSAIESSMRKDFAA